MRKNGHLANGLRDQRGEMKETKRRIPTPPKSSTVRVPDNRPMTSVVKKMRAFQDPSPKREAVERPKTTDNQSSNKRLLRTATFK